ncbi:hypothetical protein [Rhizobium beringeri]|uniref:hypothetical protein n=1 Tax=Rhizobium beringeri TaxID=3019934 RepID=UPI002E13497F|nr:hypothetical protein LZK78_29010 [Rhizobium leguminosarum]WSH30386.1 hypothetical protein U8P75_33485 [Rhizobium beringeri]WSH83671.1 hypothetical protein U8P69_27300 [Rhizobium beringeri]
MTSDIESIGGHGRRYLPSMMKQSWHRHEPTLKALREKSTSRLLTDFNLARQSGLKFDFDQDLQFGESSKRDYLDQALRRQLPGVVPTIPAKTRVKWL